MQHVEHYMYAFDRGRPDRYVFLQKRFPKIFADSKSILDVGCDDNYLKLVYGEKVFGIDIGGTPDRYVDLEKEALRGFKDNSYDLVICTEVLEHIDNLHEVFDELIRVSSKYILISLPNCSSTNRLRRLLLTGKNRKFYGLPFSRPVDRHKWFFSYKEIIDFFMYHAQQKKLTVSNLILHYSIRYSAEKRILHILKQVCTAWLVRFWGWDNQCQDVFVLFEKPHDR